MRHHSPRFALRVHDTIKSSARRLRATILPCAGLLIVASAAAFAHDWYPLECCHGQDCAPVETVTFVASEPETLPVMVVTTKWGTKPIDEKTRRYESKDERMHACIYNDRVLCLFLPPGQ